MTMRKLAIFGAGLAALLALPTTAHAKRPGVLDKKPIVERKKEFRKLRLQFTPFAGMSVAQPYVHVVSAGGQLRFNFSDTLGIRGMFEFMAVNFPTKLTRAITGENISGDPDDRNQPALPIGVKSPTSATDEPGFYRHRDDNDQQAPLLHDFKHGLTQLNWQSSVDLTFTPFSGKLGLFSTIFQSYDLYLFAGVGIQNWVQHWKGQESTSMALDLTPNTSNTSLDPEACIDSAMDGAINADCVLHPVSAQTGIKIGPSFGGGVHVFLTDWLSLNPEVQDIIVLHNDTGFSSNREVFPVVDKKDRAIRHNITLRLGLSFYLPPKTKRRTTKP